MVRTRRAGKKDSSSFALKACVRRMEQRNTEEHAGQKEDEPELSGLGVQTASPGRWRESRLEARGSLTGGFMRAREEFGPDSGV